MKNINLSGKWDFIADCEKKLLKKNDDGSINVDFTNLEWNDFINLPGTVSEQKKVPQNNEKNAGFLTDPYSCNGFMWFKKKITVNDFSNENIYKLLLERTRISHLWINNEYRGENNSLCGKHFYDITDSVAKAENHEIELIVMIDNTSYPTRGGHMTSPDTQTNWNGITGKIEIQIENKNHLEKFRISTSAAKNKNPTLTLTADFTGEQKISARLSLCNFDSEKYINLLNDNSESEENAEIQSTDEKNPVYTQEIEFLPGKNSFTFELPKNTKLWSAENPSLYRLKLESENFTKTQLCGIKTFSVNETHFEINGRKEFLRGKHDGMIFPKTGYAPTDVYNWLKVMKTSKEYGINHYRFHTCCPPDAAFFAADLLGIYMESELPFWGTIQNVGEDGFNETEQNYLISEGYKILDDFGNHTSFVMLSLGNELWGSAERLNFILKNYHDYDSRPLYTSGSNNFQFWPQTMQYEDFFVGCRFDKDSLIRGSYAMCDAPQGFIQTEEPCTNHDYNLCFSVPVKPVSDDEKKEDREIEIQYGTGVKKVKASSISANEHFLPHKPVISHEVGQYCSYPNFKEIEKYTGVLKPYNYEIFRERLKNSGMISQAEDFFRDSSRLAVQCYKQEIEALIRSSEISGFQLLDIQDFTGQGTAVVGILDSFMESKGIVTGEQWRSFCNKTVLLAAFKKFVWNECETFDAEIYFASYSDKSYKNCTICAYLINIETDEILSEDSWEIKNEDSGVQKIGNFNYKFQKINEYKKYNLVLYMNSSDDEQDNSDNSSETEFLNSYILHVYPKADEEVLKALDFLKKSGHCTYGDIFLTTDSLEAKKQASEGKKVLLIPENVDKNLPGLEKSSEKEIQTVPGTYCTDFWCYPMFKSISESMKKPVPVGTLGLTIKNDSPLFSDFKTDTYTTPKWYNIVSHATCVNLLGTDVVPQVQAIDNFERNWKLGLLWQTENIVVCTSKLYEIADKAEVVYFAKSILENM